MARRNDLPQSREDEQIDTIVKLMLRGEWRGGQSRKELAKEWGVHERTVGDRAVIASGFLRRAGGELEAEVHEALAELDTIKALALGNQRAFLVQTGRGENRESRIEYADEPKLREATEAIRLKMDIRGVTSKSRGRNDPKDPPPAEGIEALLRSVVDDPEMREKLKAMLAGKSKEMH